MHHQRSMAALTRLSRPVSWYQRFILWVVGAVLLLQVLALLSTRPCSGQTHRATRSRPPFTSLLSRLSGHAMCEGQAEKAALSFEDMFQHRNSVRRQRPYAYAFCLTSVHHLCTALVNTVRLRKLRSFQEADIVALVPKSWGPIVETSMRGKSMPELQEWAVHTAQDPLPAKTPESVKAFLEQQRQLPIFQGVALADYNLVDMFAKMVALGVIFRPSEVFEHLPGDYNKTHYHREAISKLQLFGMTEYKQILYLDADGLILQNLDAVFNLSVTPVALLPEEVNGAEGDEYTTRLMLLQPSKAVQAQLQFVVEKDLNFNDARVLSEFFLGQIHHLSADLALQSYELQTPNNISEASRKALHSILYVHLYDGIGFPRHWQWAEPSLLPKLQATCTKMCDERMFWLHIHSMLALERQGLCLHGH